MSRAAHHLTSPQPGARWPGPVDPRLLLPWPPARAIVLSSEETLNGAAGLENSGEPVLLPDLAVAPSSLVERALATHANMVVLTGTDRSRRLRRAGFQVQRYLPLPDLANVELLLPLDQPTAARYALNSWRVPSGRLMWARNTIASALLRHLSVPARRPVVTIAARGSALPHPIAAARSVGVDQIVSWLPTFPPGGDSLSRVALHLFPVGSRTPRWTLKLARIPGYDVPFVREEKAHGLIREAGGCVEQRAPRQLGRFMAGGHHASVESTAVGPGLGRLLAGPRGRPEKVAVLDSIARWLDQVARETRAPADALAPERSRLGEEVLPAWSARGVPPNLIERLPPVPAVFQHNDMWQENIVCGPGGFTVLDWEWARRHGFPLWDLARFASFTLGALDGAHSGDERDRHFVELWLGRAPASELLLRWLRRSAEVAEVPLDAVGAIVTLHWIDHPPAGRRRAGAPAAEGTPGSGEPGAPLPPPRLARLARLWLSEPGLGPGWTLWRG